MNDIRRGTGKLIGFAIALVLLLFLIKNPGEAGAATQAVWSGINTAADSLGAFVTAISK